MSNGKNHLQKPPKVAIIATATAKVSASLLMMQGSHPESEIDKVTTPMGCTIAGLNELEYQGLSSAVIQGLKKSFDKISSIGDS
jgi:pyrroline-5-carboxylate reductase